MTTIRVATRKRFTQVDRECVNDDRLSYRARGVLIWLLDKPDDWRTNSEAIARAGAEGRDAIRKALQELEDCGYLLREKLRDDLGKWTTIVTVYESSTKPQVAPTTGNPASGTRLSVVRASGNQASSSNTETNTEKHSYPKDGLARLPEPRPDCPDCDGTTRKRLPDGTYSHESCETCA